MRARLISWVSGSAPAIVPCGLTTPASGRQGHIDSLTNLPGCHLIDDFLLLYVFAGLTFLLAGTIKGTVGVGLPTTSVGILSQGLDPRLAVALVVFPIMVSNAWQVLRSGETLRALKDYWLFAVVLMLVLWPTTALTAAVSEAVLLIILGAVIVGFALINLLFTPPRLPDRYDKPAQFAGGVFGGLMGAFTATGRRRS